MFMRYRGGGIGHATNQIQLINEDDMMDMMDIGEDVYEEDTGAEDPQLADKDLVNVLLQSASTMAARSSIVGEQDEVERAVVINPDGGDDDEEDRDNASGNESDDELGPEDGEDEGYLDTGCGAL